MSTSSEKPTCSKGNIRLTLTLATSLRYVVPRDEVGKRTRSFSSLEGLARYKLRTYVPRTIMACIVFGGDGCGNGTADWGEAGGCEAYC